MTDPLNVRLVVTSGLEWPPVALPLPLNKAETEWFMRHIQDETEELRKSREGRYKPNVSSYILARSEGDYGIKTSTMCCQKQVKRFYHRVESPLTNPWDWGESEIGKDT